ncbi:membrane protein insertase YidC [Paraburkholderia sp. SIMBA_055]|jgi:YidC/Oxa1 family membrane protein insertase|uniref:Membrane protein insertase YidC n=2 Tax=Paraburkholderia graminis TaxID=60548 RepID=B1G3W6_PARG4|nr:MULTISPECIES: membrane protein insertase YidC [Paraburkholderia]AXF09648.1 membrane protein insertase YidC [Paraburkholderia graminis]EDT09317.1 60 kDa inner membrane insertion protein [Paraburkholderia graminis C4D1M]MDQ0621248.1 YidC/Oxa1 family membrane protein insertase [Paraburkholderia graminis]MDR6202037.1 YidC/Oxa1 family membrane protein insertase [Paraburkholderia graminis]MDR6469428.1 YidC/Oxa1 family membrane protein insertase [Paraburkholderia graminis]
MDIKRTVLWVIFFMSAVMLFDNWQRDHGRPSMFFPSATPTKTAGSAAPGTTTPGTQPADLPATNAAAPANTPAATQSQLVKFSTDVYSGEIDTRGGTLSKLSLVKQGDGKQPDLVITLFDRAGNHTYLARTGLLGGDFPNHNDIYTLMPNQQTELKGDQKSFSLSFESPVKGGLKVIKTYTFTRGSYVIGVDTKIQNVGTAPVSPSVYMELVRDDQPVETPRFSHTFIGPAVYTEQNHFQKMTFGDIDKNKEDYAKQADNGWIAMVQHYFASAWIPQQGVKRDIYVEKIDPALYRVGVKQPVAAIAPGQTVDVSARLFAGPEEERMLEGIAPGLELVKDYGWVTIIAKPLFWLLEKIHSYVGNWGWAIVLLTLLIKAVFFPLSAASYKSMARMKAITPRMQALRERFKGDPQKMNAALMELYKTEKVNPFGGCLPVVIQIPVFISLYWVLLSSVEMRGAPWVLWIHDLSQQDPYFILPVLMAVSMFLQTKLNPTPPDPVQAKMMMFMPIAFSVMFFFFPAGLVLYYVVNNVLSIAQQYYITRMMGQSKAKPA